MQFINQCGVYVDKIKIFEKIVGAAYIQVHSIDQIYGILIWLLLVFSQFGILGSFANGLFSLPVDTLWFSIQILSDQFNCTVWLDVNTNN